MTRGRGLQLVPEICTGVEMEWFLLERRTDLLEQTLEGCGMGFIFVETGVLRLWCELRFLVVGLFSVKWVVFEARAWRALR